jgi:hypothetical protein
MADTDKQKWKTIIDREYLMSHPEGCPACGQKFALGDPAVFACGTWGREPKLIHESNAVFDDDAQMYMERECYEGRKSG